MNYGSTELGNVGMRGLDVGAKAIGASNIKPEIKMQLENMDRQTSELAAMLDGLRGRINSVLSPAMPTKNEVQVPHSPTSSELGSAIGEYNDRIRHMQDIVRDLFERLAL